MTCILDDIVRSNDTYQRVLKGLLPFFFFMHRISLSTASLHAKNPFHIAKTKPRKAISRSPFKLFDGSVSHELGPYNQPIDLRIGNQRMILDISQGCWKRGTCQMN